MEELLQEKERFSSQELFVMFHIAYAAMYGREIADLQNMVIYWEPHQIRREDRIYYAHWLENVHSKVWMFRMVRNQCSKAGSLLRPTMMAAEARGQKGYKLRYDKIPEIWSYPNKDWDACPAVNEIVVRFEDVKCEPEKNLCALCEQLDIPWSDTLMKTTIHGNVYDYNGVRDFDLKPVYNYYKEYFSAHDKIGISILAAPWSRKYGYDYENISEYSRREIQEIMLKRPRFVKEDAYESKEQELHDRIKVQRWERDYLQMAWRMELLEGDR